MWFADSRGAVGRVTPAGALSTFPLTTPGSNPNDIASGPDGNLWFTEVNANRIGRITPAGAVTEFPVPTPGSAPNRIAAGPDGNLWFTEQHAGKVARITPAGTITEYRVAAKDLRGITAAPDGNVWFSAEGRVGRITPAGAVKLHRVKNGTVNAITAGPDGDLWFTSPDGSLGQITTAGSVTYHRLPGKDSRPVAVTTGADGGVWFSDAENGVIGRIRPRNGAYTRAPRLGGTTLTFAVKGLVAGRVIAYVETKAGTRVPMQAGSRLGTRVLAKRYYGAAVVNGRAATLPNTAVTVRFSTTPPRGARLVLVLRRPDKTLAVFTPSRRIR